MKKSIFKRIGLIALAVCVAIGSFFVPIKSDKKINSAHADNIETISTFNGSSIIQCVTGVYTSSAVLFGFTNFSTSFTNSNNILDASLNFNFYFPDVLTTTLTDSVSFNSSDYVDLTRDIAFNYNGNNYSFVYKVTSSILLDVSSIYKIHIESVDYRNEYSMATNIYYYDANENYIKFALIADSNDYTPVSNVIDLFYYTPRDYYLITEYTDSQIYNQGYNQGLADNQQNVYSNGYNAGYDIGYGNGVTAGRADANDFSFISLIGAVVDVPLQTFLGLFHFELLGINLANFILALLTVAFIVFIIKLILGSK